MIYGIKLGDDPHRRLDANFTLPGLNHRCNRVLSIESLVLSRTDAG